ncbi:MAG: undecaprenyl-diphosphate phosphatase [Firmicutes bacterium]|nr:undecaprenyl-diphosphate phosphatase [Bacillota bacterium]
MDWLQALILGIIQGLTEFLPISSSGHLIIGRELLGLEVTDNIAFETMVHCATVLSTITILRKEIATLFFKLFKLQWNPETQYIGMIFLSMIPIMIVGLFFKSTVENLFGEGLALVGAMLLVTAILLSLTSLVKFSQRKPMGWGSAFLMGMAQAIAVLPGLSRSGATIATGLLAGVKKEEVAKFSFLMVLIPILGETALSAMKGDFSTAVSGIPVSSLAIGFLAAYLSGCLACKFMIELIKRTNLLWFALYCSIAGIIALIYALC